MKKTTSAGKMIWACLIHLGYNMWGEEDAEEHPRNYYTARPYLRFDAGVWNALLERMVDAGFNMVLIDLGDGVRYESHPEIAVRRAWTPKRLRRELSKLRGMGLEPIPKLNFSATHDVWLGPYSRCVSSSAYYKVCRDLIREVIDLFDKPRFFHLGMDEETAHHQRRYQYVVMRQRDLWWHDLHFLAESVEKRGVRPWVWSDYVWHHPETFFEKMPKSVLQSNWYYGKSFSKQVDAVRAYLELEAHGYDQIATGSNWNFPENFRKTVAYCSRHIAPRRLLGFLQTIWRPTIEDCREPLEAGIDVAGKAILKWSARRRHNLPSRRTERRGARRV